MTWEGLVGPSSRARNLVLLWRWSGSCAVLCSLCLRGCSVLGRAADAVLQAVPLALPSGVRIFWEKHPRSLFFPPFNHAQVTVSIVAKLTCRHLATVRETRSSSAGFQLIAKGKSLHGSHVRRADLTSMCELHYIFLHSRKGL